MEIWNAPIEGREFQIIITTIKENNFDTSDNPYAFLRNTRYFEIQT